MFLRFLAYFNEKNLFLVALFQFKAPMCTDNFQVIAGFILVLLLQIMCKNSCLSFGRDGFMPRRDESNRNYVVHEIIAI